MTDYLEEVLENAEALLEEVRRLERGLPGPAGRTAGEMEDVSPAGGGETMRGEEPAGRSVAGNAEEAEGETARRTDWDSLVYQEERERTGPEERSGEPGPAPEGEAGAPEVSRRVRTPLEADERETSPLLEQLQRLERAADRPLRAGTGQGQDTGLSLPADTVTLPRTRPAFSDVPGAPGERQSGGGGSVRSAASAAEELRWAEQADRAFRRDSRRYDGGFYLY